MHKDAYQKLTAVFIFQYNLKSSTRLHQYFSIYNTIIEAARVSVKTKTPKSNLLLPAPEFRKLLVLEPVSLVIMAQMI